MTRELISPARPSQEVGNETQSLLVWAIEVAMNDGVRLGIVFGQNLDFLIRNKQWVRTDDLER
jgi:hypothetical protein